MEQQLALGLEAKRESMRQVLDHAGYDWQMLVRLVVRTMKGREVKAEDIRLRCAELNIAPHDPHAWGALVNLLAKEGKLIPLNKHLPMRDKRSKARQTMVYLVAVDQ